MGRDFGADDGKDEGGLRIPGERALGREAAAGFPRAGQRFRGEKGVVVPFPRGEAGAKPVVGAVTLEDLL
jgi:hypothetical protein